jgi:hypothetical protein
MRTYTEIQGNALLLAVKDVGLTSRSGAAIEFGGMSDLDVKVRRFAVAGAGLASVMSSRGFFDGKGPLLGPPGEYGAWAGQC